MSCGGRPQAERPQGTRAWLWGPKSEESRQGLGAGGDPRSARRQQRRGQNRGGANCLSFRA
eukprot:15430987-Alexandrium_andersonii.AAC.1